MKQQRATEWHAIVFESSFWTSLNKIDEWLAERLRSAGCQRCGSSLFRADYPRKPRWGWALQIADLTFRRISLCCGKEGCRRRVTPPSVRFLGRKVYVGVIVVLAAIVAEQFGRCAASASTGVPSRTLEHWRTWWCGDFARSKFFAVARSLVAGEVVVASLPRSLLERFEGAAPEAMTSALRFISPITTCSVALEALLVMGT